MIIRIKDYADGCNYKHLVGKTFSVYETETIYKVRDEYGIPFRINARHCDIVNGNDMEAERSISYSISTIPASTISGIPTVKQIIEDINRLGLDLMQKHGVFTEKGLMVSACFGELIKRLKEKYKVEE